MSLWRLIGFAGVLVAGGILGAPLAAQERLYCYRDVMARATKGGGTVQVSGFTIEVKPVPDPDVAGYMQCQGSVRSPEGNVIFEERDWGMEIDPATGKDVNGDGAPDAVLVGFSGGAHCCWTYHIVSLKDGKVVGKFENRSTASFEDLGRDGKVEVLIRDGSFDTGFGLLHPDSPFPLLIVRLEGERFEDVGAKFWPAYEREIRDERSKLKTEKLAEFLASNPADVHDDLDYLDTEYHVLSIALDYLYGGRPEEARRELAKSWPAPYRDKTWQEMLDGYCSGLRAQLEVETSRVCAHPKGL